MITIVNKHHGHQADGDRKIYIGRGSPLGNPFTHMTGTKAEYRVSSREAAIAAYRIWLEKKILDGDPLVCAALNDIALRAMTGDVELVCFCAPKACHGDVIKQTLIDHIQKAAP